VPVFDRSREIAIASARAVSPETHIVLAEGNYLLIDEAPWSRLAEMFDFTIFVGPSEEVLRERLRARWVHYGLDEAQIAWKLDGNDLPNGRYILGHSRPADIRLELLRRQASPSVPVSAIRPSLCPEPQRAKRPVSFRPAASGKGQACNSATFGRPASACACSVSRSASST